MQPRLNVQAILGEGPHWDEEHGLLWFVDIAGRAVHRYHPASGQHQRLGVPDMVSTVVPRSRGGLIITMGRGFYTLDWESGTLSLLAEVETDRPNNRFNDGKCDAKGRFWAGTLDKQENQPLGALYCLDVDHTVKKVLDGITVSNGIGWSPDNRIMYYIDSPTKKVVAFDYDLDRASLSHRRDVLHIHEGSPDGMTVDQDGMLWIAHWGGSQVSRWDPESATLIETYSLPVERVTSLAFGGPDFTELFVTTAGRQNPSEPPNEKFAGDVFSITAPVAGLRGHQYAG